MFGGKFGLMRFGLRGEAITDLEISVLFIERIRSLISAGEDIIIEKEFRENYHSSITLTRGIPITHSFRENVSALLNAAKDYAINAEYGETVQSNVWLAGNIEERREFTEAVDADIFLGLNTPVAQEYFENISVNAFLGKNTPLAHEFREAVFALTMATLLEKFAFTVTEALNPGDELRIDSALFTAMIGEKNVIHQYSGDWLVLDKNAINLQVNGDLSGRLIFNERYL